MQRPGARLGAGAVEVLRLKDGTFTESIAAAKLMNDSYSESRVQTWACAQRVRLSECGVLKDFFLHAAGGGRSVAAATRSFAVCRCACLKMHWSQLVKRPLTSVTAVSGEGGGADIMGFDICLSYGDGWCVSLSFPRDA